MGNSAIIRQHVARQWKLYELTPEEIERYKRHLVLREVGGQGQQKLKAAKVLVIGAGGLGSPVLMYLAAAGVGTLGIIDDDRVSLDNLQRQIVHDTPHVGVAKVASAQETIAKLNPHVRVETHDTRIDAGNALDIIARYDIVADGSDNFATRYLVSDACYLAKRTAGVRRRRPVRRLCHDLQAARARARTASPIPPTAASSPRRRRPARLPTAPRSACWAPPSASSARCRRPRC